MIYFTSDLHFYHKNIISHTGRPFRNVDEMDEALVRNWNNTVMPDDDIYILGDVTMRGPDAAYQMLSRLQGRKYLIRGNHDKFVEQQTWKQYSWIFEWVKDYHELTIGNDVFILCHYPFAEWNEFFRGSIDLHGHQHNHQEYNEEQRAAGIRRYDVGVDANTFAPVSYERILQQVAPAGPQGQSTKPLSR